MQQKSSLKYMILEKKIITMREELNIKDAQLHAKDKGDNWMIGHLGSLKLIYAI